MIVGKIVFVIGEDTVVDGRGFDGGRRIGPPVDQSLIRSQTICDITVTCCIVLVGKGNIQRVSDADYHLKIWNYALPKR